MHMLSLNIMDMQLEAQHFGRRTEPFSKKDRKMKSLVLFGNVVF